MKSILLYLLSAMVLQLGAQTYDVPPDSIIIKNKIKSITGYFNDDSTKNELSQKWEFNLAGKLVAMEAFDSEDTSKCITLYFYKEHLLTEVWGIGTQDHYDTVRTRYFYDHKQRRIKETQTGKCSTMNKQELNKTISTTYINDTIALKNYDDEGRPNKSACIDSILFAADKTIKYIYNASLDLKIAYTYNKQGQVTTIIKTSISKPSLTFHYNYFSYENGRLIKEIEGHSYTGEKEMNGERVYYYAYNDRGMITKVQRPLTFETYSYKYYK